MMTPEEKEALEKLIDKHGMTQVLSVLSEIACDKGDHIRENWQDGITAREWDFMGAKLMNLSLRAHAHLRS